MNPHVYLLVKIVKQSKENFMRWCKVHAGYGFARIYVFDEGIAPWYNEAVKEVGELYKNFTFLNVDSKWNKRSEILRAFCKHCNNGDWGIILSSNEFLYTDKWQNFDVRKLVGFAIRAHHAHALSIYKEYLSENDGYQFKKKNYKSYTREDAKYPISSTVLFSVQDKNALPLAAPQIPADRSRWFDSNWNEIELESFMSTTPIYSSYPVRVFKLYERNFISDSDFEKFDCDDDTFWKFYQYMCPDFTPKYHEVGDYRKSIEDEARAKAEAAKEINVKNENVPFEDDGEIIGVIVDGILHGKSFDDISIDVRNTRIAISDDDIKMIYERECYNVIRSNKPYAMLIKMLSDGIKQKDIMHTLKISSKALKVMKDTLIAMPAEIKAKFDEFNAVDTPQTEEIPATTTDETEFTAEDKSATESENM